MFRKLVAYLAEVRLELSKVSWPTRSEMIESARIVLITSFVLAAAVFVVDYMLSSALKMVL
jgi:preprotein translocase subunit SecE